MLFAWRIGLETCQAPFWPAALCGLYHTTEENTPSPPMHASSNVLSLLLTLDTMAVPNQTTTTTTTTTTMMTTTMTMTIAAPMWVPRKVLLGAGVLLAASPAT